MDEILFSAVKEFGPLAGVVLFFVWRDWKRESHLNARIVSLEEDQRTILLATIEKTTRVIERNTVVMEHNANTMAKLNESVDRLMCR